MKKESLSFPRQVAYAIGQLGWSILINIIGFHQVYFYLPPDDAGLPELIVKVAFFGISTIGVVSALGRLWDGITDPFIANLSDRWKSNWGRRVPFLAVGGIPAAAFCVMVFIPPDRAISTVNLIWMSSSLFLFYAFLTVYVTPYFALIPELGHTANERLNISTLISVTYALGIMVAAQVPLIAENLQKGFVMDKYTSYQTAIMILSAIAAFCMYFPVFAISEKRYCLSVPSTVPFKEALKMTFKNRDFVYFSVSDFNYFLSLSILTVGITYYVKVLLNQEESLVSQILPVMLFSSFLCYPLVNFFARRTGKKNLVLIGFGVFFIVFMFIFFMGMEFIPIPNIVQAYLVVALAGIPMAILGILPNAILADIAELDAIKTGSRREGLFYAARTLMQKLGQTIGVLLFSSILLLGGGVKKVEKEVNGVKVIDREQSNLIGVQATGPVAGFFCILAILTFSKYKEKETLEEIARSGGE
ncbi:MAG: MFS transporter [Leptospiraceae bacterium]|nr:MFS transporter [Leptospiraceae bacterium]MCP5511316.1 MFS transporter [Leptospiraceae bacterium]